MLDTFQVLADPTRRRLVEALRGGERSVSELVDAAGIGQPGVSRQLAILAGADWVVVRPEGRRRLYALRPEPFWAISEWMQGYRAVWEARLDRLAAELDRRQAKRGGGDRRTRRRRGGRRHNTHKGD